MATYYFKMGIFTLGVGVLFASSITFASALWQGTSWVTDGGIISATKIKANFDYLKEQVAEAGLWSKSGNNTYFNTGNVGVGITPSSTVKLYAYQTGNKPAIYGITTGAHYGVYAQSGGNYGIYGKTQSARHGGVLGYSANSASYGILGHANTYALYGRGQLYVTDKIRTPNQVWASQYCDASGNNCFSAKDVRAVTPPPPASRCTNPSGANGSTYTYRSCPDGGAKVYLCSESNWVHVSGRCIFGGP